MYEEAVDDGARPGVTSWRSLALWAATSTLLACAQAPPRPLAAAGTSAARTHLHYRVALAPSLERMEVELCFEGDRYWTLTRRLMLGKAEHTAVYALDVNAPDNGQGFSFTGLYTRKLMQQRYWRDKMYLFPIGQGDMERDRALVQNPGW